LHFWKLASPEPNDEAQERKDGGKKEGEEGWEKAYLNNKVKTAYQISPSIKGVPFASEFKNCCGM
jgi:hypothetical protein